MFFSTEIDPHGAPSSMEYFRRAAMQYNTIKYNKVKLSTLMYTVTFL